MCPGRRLLRPRLVGCGFAACCLAARASRTRCERKFHGPPNEHPSDIASRVASLPKQARERAAVRDVASPDLWLPRDKAREIAKEWFERYPKAAYLTQVESWGLTEDGIVEFTMRRLPTAD